MNGKWNIDFNMEVNITESRLVNSIAECKALARVINKIPITPSRQKKIDSLNILRAIRGTTNIEGATASEEEVKMILNSPAKTRILPASRKAEEQEYRNGQKLMKYIANLLSKEQEAVLNEKLICKCHEIITKNMKYEDNVPGQYRNKPVRVGNYQPPLPNRNKPVRVGNYQPPLPNDIKDLIAQFLYCFNEGKATNYDPIIQAIVAHFYLVSIHPFSDGNGRTARAIEGFLLLKNGINARGFYSLANYYYKNRREYIELLDQVRFDNKNDLTPFIIFAMHGLSQELEDVHNEIISEVKHIAFRDLVRETLFNKLESKLGKRLLEFIMLLGDDTVSIKSIKQSTK